MYVYRHSIRAFRRGDGQDLNRIRGRGLSGAVCTAGMEGGALWSWSWSGVRTFRSPRGRLELHSTPRLDCAPKGRAGVIG